MDKERKACIAKLLRRKLTKEQREVADVIFDAILHPEDDDDEEVKIAPEMTKSEALSFLHKLGNCHFGTPITISDDDEIMEGIFIKIDDDGYIRYMAYNENEQTMCYGQCAPMLIKFKGE